MENQETPKVDMTTIGAMLFSGLFALMLKSGMTEEQIGTSLAMASGAAPEEQ